jgi:hypothetical protein
MKHRVLFALAFAAAAVHAQVPDAAAERERIKAERGAAEARYKEAQKACRQKFAVTDCLDKARREHNTATDELKRQEHVLNDAERRKRAADAQKQIDEKNSPEQQQKEAERRARNLAEQQERDAKAAEKASKRAADEAQREKKGPRAKAPHGASGPQGGARDPRAPVAHGPTPTEAAKNRTDYDRRIAEAEQHKAEIAARNAKRTKPPAADLPPPIRAGS